MEAETAAHPEHPQGLKHHFEDLGQQQDAATLGMWTFLVTEIMFFGGMFLAYGLYRATYPEAFANTSRHMDVWLGAVNTAVLICSSLTMVLAVHASRIGNRRSLVWNLVGTMLLGGVFLAVKAFEYHHKWEEHLIPGLRFAYDQPQLAHAAEILFFLYFCMTGMHAVHMIIGEGLLAWLLVGALRGRFTPAWNTPVDMIGLYWHFVDIVWIFLFPLLYLIG